MALKICQDDLLFSHFQHFKPCLVSERSDQRELRVDIQWLEDKLINETIV